MQSRWLTDKDTLQHKQHVYELNKSCHQTSEILTHISQCQYCLKPYQYRNMRHRNCKAEITDKQSFPGWGRGKKNLKPFKISQQNVAEIKRNFYHNLIWLHLQREVAETKTLMCWPFLYLYYITISPGDSGGKRYNLVYLKTNCPVQTNQNSLYYFPFGTN